MAWSLSKGNSLRLTFLVGVIPLLTDSFFFSLLPESDSLIYRGFYYLAWAVVAVIEVGILSLSYQWLQTQCLNKPMESSETG